MGQSSAQGWADVAFTQPLRRAHSSRGYQEGGSDLERSGCANLVRGEIDCVQCGALAEAICEGTPPRVADVVLGELEGLEPRLVHVRPAGQGCGLG